MCVAVFSLPGKTWWVYLSSAGKWGVKREDAFVKFSGPKTCLPLLPLLELTYLDGVALVLEGIQKVAGPPQLLETFPFYEPLYLALTWSTGYWPALALDWFESGHPLSSGFVPLLEKAWKNKAYPQALRHRAKRMFFRGVIVD